jgi:predicted dehydrogenase
MTLSSETVAIALVGGGTIAPLHAQYLRSSSTCALIALIDPFPPGQKLALQLGVPHFASVEDLLRSSSKVPDGYIVCVPSSLHVQVTKDILKSSSPRAILVEKPFCTDSKSGEQLLELAQLRSCQLLVGHHRRFHPSVVRARQVIERGEIGKIMAISGFWTAKKNDAISLLQTGAAPAPLVVDLSGPTSSTTSMYCTT